MLIICDGLKDTNAFCQKILCHNRPYEEDALQTNSTQTTLNINTTNVPTSIRSNSYGTSCTIDIAK